MPWCGYWGAPFGGFWWLMPLFGLVFMGFMAFFCFRGFRGFGWSGWRHRSTSDLSDLQREVASLREEIRNLRQRS